MNKSRNVCVIALVAVTFLTGASCTEDFTKNAIQDAKENILNQLSSGAISSAVQRLGKTEEVSCVVIDGRINDDSWVVRVRSFGPDDIKAPDNKAKEPSIQIQKKINSLCLGFYQDDGTKPLAPIAEEAD